MGVCPFHCIIHLDQTGKFRVNSSCRNVFDIRQKSWFILPPSQAWFYKQNNPDYQPLPPYAEGCDPEERKNIMEIIYPHKLSQLFVPIEFSGKKGRVVFKVAHRDPGARIYWHVDRQYQGYTDEIHELSLHPEPGRHMLNLTDDKGNTLSQTFIVMED